MTYPVENITRAEALRDWFLFAPLRDWVDTLPDSYDGPCIGEGWKAPCPVCGMDGFTNADGTIRSHRIRFAGGR